MQKLTLLLQVRPRGANFSELPLVKRFASWMATTHPRVQLQQPVEKVPPMAPTTPLTLPCSHASWGGGQSWTISGGTTKGPPLILEIYLVKRPLVANFYVILAPPPCPRPTWILYVKVTEKYELVYELVEIKMKWKVKSLRNDWGFD